MIGDDTVSISHRLSRPLQRNVGIKAKWSPFRYIHTETKRLVKYEPGRHDYVVMNDTIQLSVTENAGFIMKFLYTPWPEILERKVSVGITIPKSDKELGMGTHHTQTAKNPSLLELWRQEFIANFYSERIKLCDFNYSSNNDSNNDWKVRKEYHFNFGHCLS
jgi:hypothetical protein